MNLFPCQRSQYQSNEFDRNVSARNVFKDVRNARRILTNARIQILSRDFVMVSSFNWYFFFFCTLSMGWWQSHMNFFIFSVKKYYNNCERAHIISFTDYYYYSRVLSFYRMDVLEIGARLSDKVRSCHDSQNSKLYRTRRWYYRSLATRKTTIDWIKMSEFRPHARCEYNEIIVLVPETKFYYYIIFFSVECKKVAVGTKAPCAPHDKIHGPIFVRKSTLTHSRIGQKAYLCRCSRTRRSSCSLFMLEILIFFMSPSSSPFNGFMFALLCAVATFV